MSRSSPIAALALGVVAASRASALDAPLPVVERELNNGLKVLVLEDRSIPNVAVYVGWRVGSRNEVPGITGLAHFFEHMMFSGGARYGGHFDPIMEAAGGSNNAYTSQDVTVYQDWVPSAQLPLVLDMEADRMRGMRFDPAAVETERGVVASERRLSMEEPVEVMREQLWAAAYTAHPYQWSVLGHMVDIMGWRQEDLERFFATHYAPNNAVLVIVGDVEPATAFELVEEKMGAIPRGPERRPIHTQEPPQKGERRVVVEDENAHLRQVMAAWHIGRTGDADFPAVEVLERLLLVGESSRLYQALVEREAVCLDVGGGFQGYQFDPSLFAVELTMREGVAPEHGEALLYAELDRLAREGPTARELDKAKNGLVAAVVRQLKTINGKASLLMDAELFFGGWQRLPEHIAAVRAVTAEDVTRVAAATFTRKNRTVVTLEVPEGRTAAAATDAEAGTEADAEAEAEADEAEAKPAPAPRPRPELPAPLPGKGKAVRLPATVDFQLANGLRVILVPDRDVPVLSLQARVAGGGLEDAPGKEGATALLATLLGKGAGERDAVAFQEAVDFVGGHFGAAAGTRWLEVQAEFLSKDTALALDLLADALLRPRLDAAELDKEKGKAKDAIAAAREEPSQIIGRYFGAWLFRGHPFARPAGGDERSLERVTHDDVKAAARRVLVPARTWLVVAGDFDPAELRPALEARFGGWEAEAAAPAAAPGPAPATASRVLLVNKPDSLQTYFMFGNVAFDWSDPDYAARFLANTVLGGRFTSRLNKALRVDSGLTYGARSWVDDVRKGPLIVSTYTATDTSREALELAHRVYRDFVAGGLTQEELDSARAYIKGQYAPDTLETADQVGAMVLSLAFDGLPRDVVDRFFERLDALTLEKVNQVITRRLPKDALAWVVVGQADVLRPIVKQFGEVTQVELKAPGFGPGF
ncbi:MAG: insulinase family protein [Planctomycetes bacterium]|nr:insulinase family protein [Planctomycetota bacterium]